MFLLILLTPIVGVYAYLRLDEYLEERFRARLGTDDPNFFFSSRIRSGMTAQEVGNSVPPADHVNFFLMEDSSVVQQFVYARPFSVDYQVNAVFADKRVVDVEFDDTYLGRITALSPQEAMTRLGAPQSETRANEKSARVGADVRILFFGRPIIPRADSITPTSEWSQNDDRDTLFVVIPGNAGRIVGFEVAFIVERTKPTDDDERIVLGVDTVVVSRGQRLSQSARQWGSGTVMAELHPSAFAARLAADQMPANVLVTVKAEANGTVQAKCELLFD